MMNKAGASQHLRLKKNSILFFMFLLSNISFGQDLSLDDIFKIHSLDSITLKKFCSEKNYALVNTTEDDWAYYYTFHSLDNNKLTVDRLFPKGEHAKPFVRYSFVTEKNYRDFESLIKARGFTRIKYKPVGKKIKTDISTKYYFNKVSKMEIGMEKYSIGPAKYAITLYLSPYES